MAKPYLVINVEKIEDYVVSVFDTKKEADEMCYLCNALCNTKRYITHAYNPVTHILELLGEDEDFE